MQVLIFGFFYILVKWNDIFNPKIANHVSNFGILHIEEQTYIDHTNLKLYNISFFSHFCLQILIYIQNLIYKCCHTLYNSN
jgi:Flp pilus assembly protein protease CpaA